VTENINTAIIDRVRENELETKVR